MDYRFYVEVIFLKFRDKIIRFMMGRNGPDNLYNFLLIVELVLVALNIFFPSFIWAILMLATMGYSFFRVFSRNVSKRRAENAKYLSIKRKITGIFKRQKFPDHNKKTHVFRICPECKAKIRLPRKKGAHQVRCPRCKVLFDVHIR